MQIMATKGDNRANVLVDLGYDGPEYLPAVPRAPQKRILVEQVAFHVLKRREINLIHRQFDELGHARPYLGKPKRMNADRFQFAARMIQFVPSDCNMAHLPIVAASIAVPAVALPNGATFDDALLTNCAA